MSRPIGACAVIQAGVAREFGVPLHDLLSNQRARRVTRPRQVAMYLSKRLTHYSLPQIGQCFGGLDHTTIIHGVRAVEALMDAEPWWAQRIARIEAELRDSGSLQIEAAIEDVGEFYSSQIRGLTRRALARDPVRTARAVIAALQSIVGAAMVILAAGPAAAQEPSVCEDRSIILAALGRKFNELPTAAALSNSGILIELVRSPDGSTWTLLMVSPHGVACVVDAGENWQELPPPVKGDPS